MQMLLIQGNSTHVAESKDSWNHMIDLRYKLDQVYLFYKWLTL